MAKQKIKLYWLLLLVMLYTTNMVMSVGETQARYVNTAVWNTTIQTDPGTLSSNCMVSDGDVPLTVLLGEMSLYSASKVDFWLKTTGKGDVEQKFTWVVDNPEYVRVDILSGMESIEKNTPVKLIDGIPLELTMTLTATEIARATAHEEIMVNIVVAWGDSMKGYFKVLLPAVEDTSAGDEEHPDLPAEGDGELTDPTEGEEIAADPTEGEGISTEPTEEETTPTEPEETVVEEVSDPSEAADMIQALKQPPRPSVQAMSAEEEAPTEPDSKSGTEPQETEPGTEATTEPESDETEPATEPTESGETEPATEPTESGETEPATEPTESDETEPTTQPTESDETEPATQPTESEETEPATEPTDPIETEPTTEPTEPVVPETLVKLTTIDGFDPGAILPVKLVFTGDIASVRLGLGAVGEDGEETTIQPFPASTRFSVNQGESYYMMYSGYVAEFTVQGQDSLTVMLDLSGTALDTSRDLILIAQALNADGEIISSGIAITSPNAQENFRVETLSVEQELMMFSAEPAKLSETTEEAAQTAQETTHILTQRNSLKFTLPDSWKGYAFDYSVEMMTLNAESEVEYVEVWLNDGSLAAEYTNDERNHTLTFRTGPRLPQAGTYRVNMKWSYEGICYAQKQTTFFINYSSYTTQTMSSQEVPNNE